MSRLDVWPPKVVGVHVKNKSMLSKRHVLFADVVNALNGKEALETGLGVWNIWLGEKTDAPGIMWLLQEIFLYMKKFICKICNPAIFTKIALYKKASLFYKRVKF